MYRDRPVNETGHSPQARSLLLGVGKNARMDVLLPTHKDIPKIDGKLLSFGFDILKSIVHAFIVASPKMVFVSLRPAGCLTHGTVPVGLSNS